MQAKPEDLEQLLEVQKTDLALLQLQKKLEELPQRALISSLVEKRSKLQEKREQVDDMQVKAQTELKKLETEDMMLADKQQHVQELIENTGSDYRSVESHSREMEGFAKRRETLSDRLEKLAAELSKIEKIEAQFDAALALIDKDEAKARAEYDDESSVIADQTNDLRQLREQQVARVDAELVKLYESTAAKTAGVAIGRLEDNRCGVCRSVIDGGRLIQLKAEAPLGVCPSCRRLLVIFNQEE